MKGDVLCDCCVYATKDKNESEVEEQVKSKSRKGRQSDIFFLTFHHITHRC